MVENPVFVKEMRQSFFRRKPITACAIWAGTTFVLLWLASATRAGYLVTILPMVALPLIVPAFAAGTFAKEYDQMTWQDLYLTRLTNFQVVWGKFLAAFLLVMVMALSVVPAMTLVFWQQLKGVLDGPWPDFRHWLLIGEWLAGTLSRMTLSACLYVVMAMVCSRYSPNGRVALTWCYVALFLYALCGFFIWWSLESSLSHLSSAAYMADAYRATTGGYSTSSGIMGMISLMVDCVVGVGMLVLLWVSMSEQRGYKAKDEDGTGKDAGARLTTAQLRGKDARRRKVSFR